MTRFVTALALVTAAWAQAPKTFPLGQLTVEGNQIYDQKKILAVAGLHLGQQVSEAQFEAARQKLMATGAFEQVAYHFGPDASNQNIVGTFTVSEVELLYPFRFEDLPLKDEELRAALRQREPLFETRMPGTKEAMTRVARELSEVTAAKGMKDSVEATVQADGPGQLVVLFRPRTPAVRVGEVKFEGNEILPAAQLNNAFGMVAIGTAYSEKNIRALLDSGIVPLYEARGRLRVAFPKIEAKKMATVEGVSVTVQVVEGPSYNFGAIQAQGTPLTSKELLTAAALKSGDPANFDAVRAAVSSIQKRFSDAGFVRSETTFDRKVDDKEHKVDVLFKTASGPRYTMGKFAIQGLDVTVEPAIRKLWSMTEGKPFNAGYPQFFLDKVKEDGYLENLGRTTFEQKVHEDSKTVDITLYFAGAPPKIEERGKQPGENRP